MITIGLGSYAYRYSIGFPGFVPEKPMTVQDLLQEAHLLGFNTVQLCDNLALEKMSREEIEKIGEHASSLGLLVEVGMKGLNPENLMKHLEIADIMSSKFLRVVIGQSIYSCTGEKRSSIIRNATGILKEALPYCKEHNIRIGIENHFDLTSDDLVEIVRLIDDESVGLILDTTNCLGFIEKPSETLEKFGPYLFSVHLKDYLVEKVEAGYLVSGTVLGEGLLDCEQILKGCIKYNPDCNITIEMTIRRQETQNINDVILWEKNAVQKSKAYLDRLTGSLI